MTAYVIVTYFWFINLLCFACYGLDKRRAKRGEWRIAERYLHLLVLLGGCLGALFAQYYFRHKIRKWRFLAVTYLIILLQFSLLAAWLWHWPLK